MPPPLRSSPGEGSDNQSRWESLATAGGFGQGSGAFPLSLHASHADALVRENGRDLVVGFDERGRSGQCLDIPAWLVMGTIVIYDLARE